MQERSDDQLIKAFLDGEREAIETIDLWLERATWPYRRRLVGELDDVLQDIRLEITRLMQRKDFRGDSSLKTYLWRVANHACLDRLRSKHRWAWTDFEDIADHLERTDLCPSEHGPRFETRDLMTRVIQAVPKECKKLWIMIASGYTYIEMSRRLDVAAGTLRVRVKRCREKAIAIRQQLLEEDQEASG